MNLGQSIIWLAHPNVNLMLEAAYTTTEVDTSTGTSRSESFFVSPGMRGSIELGGVQVVGGVALPVGFGPSSGSLGVLGYLSFEHAVTQNPW
jgi:hypothetical protein